MISAPAGENLSALGGTRTLNLLIRRSGHIVQDRPSPVMGWVDIPELSTCVGSCSEAWLQSWLQSRRNGADPRSSANEGRTYPQLARIVRALCAIAGRCWWPVAAAVAVTVAVSRGPIRAVLS
jgi:hypothetical protein